MKKIFLLLLLVLLGCTMTEQTALQTIQTSADYQEFAAEKNIQPQIVELEKVNQEFIDQKTAEWTSENRPQFTAVFNGWETAQNPYYVWGIDTGSTNAFMALIDGKKVINFYAVLIVQQ